MLEAPRWFGDDGSARRKKFDWGNVPQDFYPKFDYSVLRAITDFDLKKLPTFDLLTDIYRRLHFRLSLGHLAEKTLAAAKLADGVQSLKWVREGRMDLVEEYCRHDVAITRDLFHFGIKHHKLIFTDKQGRNLEPAVDWDLEKILNSFHKAY